MDRSFISVPLLSCLCVSGLFYSDPVLAQSSLKAQELFESFPFEDTQPFSGSSHVSGNLSLGRESNSLAEELIERIDTSQTFQEALQIIGSQPDYRFQESFYSWEWIYGNARSLELMVKIENGIYAGSKSLSSSGIESPNEQPSYSSLSELYDQLGSGHSFFAEAGSALSLAEIESRVGKAGTRSNLETFGWIIDGEYLEISVFENDTNIEGLYLGNFPSKS